MASLGEGNPVGTFTLLLGAQRAQEHTWNFCTQSYAVWKKTRVKWKDYSAPKPTTALSVRLGRMSPEWNACVESQRLFGEDRLEVKVWRPIREKIDRTALIVSGDVVENLWMRTRGGQMRWCSGCLIPTTQPGCKHQFVLPQEIRENFQFGSDALIPKGSLTLALMGDFDLQASTGNTIVLQKAGPGNSWIEGENFLSHFFN